MYVDGVIPIYTVTLQLWSVVIYYALGHQRLYTNTSSRVYEDIITYSTDSGMPMHMYGWVI
jgi:hypothetical protein